MKDIFNSIYKWVGTDGLLHFLVCYAMIISLLMAVNPILATGLTLIVALAKEVVDYFVRKTNNFMQVIHDLICDCLGIIAAHVYIGLISLILI